MDHITISVKLPRVNRDDAQAALDAMEEIFDDYELPDDARQTLWENYHTFASDVLTAHHQPSR